ncbi:MAG: ABC transporter ATP-binding protein [Firmicutes bacterium]|nr:ABC transporter ATP-binding protein [Bacillota bacterium]
MQAFPVFPLADSPVLEVRGLTKIFRRGKAPPVTAVDGLDLTLRPGETVGLLGPNGAGKTTTIKCILGLMRPTAGSIRILGHDVESDRYRAIAHAAAVLEGARNVYWRLTARENVRFFTGLHGLEWRKHRDYCEGLLRRFGLADRADEPLLNFSHGMKQKVAVVATLAKRTPLVFLDEPTLGLDIETSHDLRALLRELAREDGRTIVVSSHDMDVIQDICDRVVILKAGRVVADASVDSLLDLFRTRSYRLALSDGLGSQAVERLLERLEGVAADLKADLKAKPGSGRTELRFTLASAEGLYRVIDLVREAGALVESIAQEEPDLEEAFLRLVREGGDVR